MYRTIFSLSNKGEAIFIEDNPLITGIPNTVISLKVHGKINSDVNIACILQRVGIKNYKKVENDRIFPRISSCPVFVDIFQPISYLSSFSLIITQSTPLKFLRE